VWCAFGTWDDVPEPGRFATRGFEAFATVARFQAEDTCDGVQVVAHDRPAQRSTAARLGSGRALFCPV